LEGLETYERGIKETAAVFLIGRRGQRHLARNLVPPYNILMAEYKLHNEFTAIIERDGKWYIGYCPEIPGVNGQGATVEACKKTSPIPSH
jgi:hypothetical protein